MIVNRRRRSASDEAAQLPHDANAKLFGSN